MSQEKTIRFIDTNYRTLFTLPDGGNLRMTFPDGRSKVSRCRYVDEYHTEVAGRVYHICEFAGHMERHRLRAGGAPAQAEGKAGASAPAAAAEAAQGAAPRADRTQTGKSRTGAMTCSIRRK